MGSPGNPSYQEQFGISSSPLGGTGVAQPSVAELELEAQKALARAMNPNAYAAQGNPSEWVAPNVEPEIERWKKLYGESENEKGQARRREAELTEAFNGLMTQFEALQAQTPPQQWQPQAPPQYGQMPYGQQQPFSNPFDSIKDDDYLDGKTFKNLVESTIAPALAFTAQQAQQSAQRSAALEQQLMAQVKASAGIDKIDEFRISSKNPWINRLPYGERISAIKALKAAETPFQQVTPQQAQAHTESQNRIVNKLTYIEGGNPNVPDATEAALEAAKQRDWAMAMQLPMDTGERAKALRAFATKYNMNFGQNPSDLAR